MKTKAGFVTMTLLLVIISGFFITCTVRSESREASVTAEAYYVELEKTYVQEVRALLYEAGFKNSGVMLTRTVYEDGSRLYLLNIHHNGISRLSEEEKDSLKKRLETAAFCVPDTEFCCVLREN